MERAAGSESPSAGLQIVLRTRDHSAIYSPASHSLSLQTRPSAGALLRSPLPLPAPPDGDESPEEYTFCPTCFRPWHGSGVGGTGAGSDSENAGAHAQSPFEASATVPHYFRLLAQGPAIDDSSSVGTTRPGTPTHQQSSAAGSRRDSFQGGSSGAEGYYKRFFVELRKLGRGGSGQVFLCQHVLNGHKLGTYAVKKIPCSNQSAHLLESLKEVHMMETLQHPNVIHYQHAWIESAQSGPFSPTVPTLHVLMMAANGGSLADWIYLRSGHKFDSPRPSGRSSTASAVPDRARAEKLKAAFRKRKAAKGRLGEIRLSEDTPAVHLLREDETISLIHDIASGLAFLHSRGVLHLDLKPANALLHWDEDALIPRVLISDFGSSTFLKDSWMRRRSGNTGTMEFMAPEAIRRHPQTGQLVELSRKADTWSLGMILHLLLYFRLPYSQIDDFDVLRTEMLAYQGWADDPTEDTPSSSRLRPLLRDLLTVDPAKRPSADEVLSRLAELTATPQQPASPHRRTSASAGKREVDAIQPPSLAATHPAFQRRLSLSAPRSNHPGAPQLRRLASSSALVQAARSRLPVLVAAALCLLKIALLDFTCGALSRPRRSATYLTLVLSLTECVLAAQRPAGRRATAQRTTWTPYLAASLFAAHVALLAFPHMCCI